MTRNATGHSGDVDATTTALMSQTAAGGRSTGAAPPIHTGGDAVAAQLAASGVDTLFGVPGIQLDYLLDGVAQRSDSLRFVSCRHEQGAAYMADGYARASGRAGVFAVVPGPGVLNASAGLATAYACSSPVVCLAGQISSWAIDRGLGLLHEVSNQDRVLRSVAKKVTRAGGSDELAVSVREALEAALSDRPRPVAVELPDDLLKAPFTGGLDLTPVTPVRLEPDQDVITRAAALLSQAEHPVIYAGWGVVSADATDALSAFAAATRAPIATSSNGRGAVSDLNPWALTSLGARRILPHADVVLIVGSRGLRMDGSPLVDATTTQITLNADARDLGEPRNPAVAIHANVRSGLEALRAAAGPPRSVWTKSEIADVRAWCEQEIATLGEIAEWVSALREGTPDDGVLVGELTQAFYLSRVAYPVYEPRTNLSPGYQGTLGYGVATAIGAKLARPDTAVVSISGDGGFCYQLGELLTAVQYQVPTVFVVFNDNAYGNILRTQLEQFDGRVIGSHLTNPDFGDLARAIGLASMRAASPTELVAALRDATRSDRPTLIEVPIRSLADPGPLVREVRNGK